MDEIRSIPVALDQLYTDVYYVSNYKYIYYVCICVIYAHDRSGLTQTVTILFLGPYISRFPYLRLSRTVTCERARASVIHSITVHYWLQPRLWRAHYKFKKKFVASALNAVPCRDVVCMAIAISFCINLLAANYSRSKMVAGEPKGCAVKLQQREALQYRQVKCLCAPHINLPSFHCFE